MTYSVKECFYTLQGEGAQTGRAAVFIRFSGCNLWSGRPADRSGAVCSFCDTDFVGTDGEGGGRFTTAADLVSHAEKRWRGEGGVPYFLCTGGEPLLQLDEALIEEMHARGFQVGVETNGTLPVPQSVDWICVSPKSTAELRQRHGNELKLVYPQPDALPERFTDLAFSSFYLQPMDGPDRAANTAACVAYCMSHPQWRISLQTHKIIGIP